MFHIESRENKLQRKPIPDHSYMYVIKTRNSFFQKVFIVNDKMTGIKSITMSKAPSKSNSKPGSVHQLLHPKPLVVICLATCLYTETML